MGKTWRIPEDAVKAGQKETSGKNSKMIFLTRLKMEKGSKEYREEST